MSLPDDAPSLPVILGIGASAGGLEACQALLEKLQKSDRFALVLVQHLDPEHVSMLPDILSRRCVLPVKAITDGMEVEAGHVYLIPPAYELELDGNILRLLPFDSPRGLRRPIDRFLESLARSRGPNAAAAIVSGTGSDGSQGVRAIKEAGGLVFAQDPHETRHDGMPRSAIATDAVDMVLPAGDMIPVLRDFHDRRQGIAPAIESDRDFLDKVIRNVRYRTGHEFSGYKHATILRRVSLRMSVLGMNEPEHYLRELVQNKREAQRLYRDLLINVTSFFRDPDVFETLRNHVIPKILRGKGPGEEVRIWIPGCSTGQEAYSVAMLVADAMERADIRPRVSIFGTDIDDEALEIARRGFYGSSIATEVPPAFLDRYFTPSRTGYEVSAALREIVRFSAQSLIKDPPFSKLDLLSCRNLLIYFDGSLQDLATRVFHYALRPKGFLVIGPSESPRFEGDTFREVVSGQRIFQRNAAPSRPLDLPRGYRPVSAAPIDQQAVPSVEKVLGVPVDVARRILERHCPPFLLIGPQDEVQQIGPGAARYVQMADGKTTLGLRSLILPALEPAIKRLLTGLALGPGNFRQIEVTDPGPNLPPRLLLSAEMLPDKAQRLVTIAPLAATAGQVDGAEARIVIDDAYVSQLEDELEDARETVRSTTEALETSNEELRSSNEEMMAMNEELQSANEELSTTNEELQSKLRELHEANTDLANFTESTQIATVFLDEDLRLRNFTPEAVAYFRFVEQDRGRALEDIGARLDMSALITCCRRVADSGLSEEHDFTTLDGKAEVSVRIAAYRSDEMGAGGVVFSVFDVTAVARYAKDLENATAEANARLEEIEELYRVSPIAMALVDETLRCIRVNPDLAKINGFSTEDHIGRLITEVAPKFGGAAAIAVPQVLKTGESLLRQMVRSRDADDAPRIWEVDWYPVRQAGKPRAVGMNVREVTRYVDMQADLRRIMRELQHRVKNMLSNVIALVNRARREKGDPAVVMETLDQRIRALAHTHNLLTAENWSSTAIRDVLTPELLQIYGKDRVILKGPDLRLNARGTLAVGMAVHELATNAAKYGAFSSARGQVRVRWSRLDEGEGERLILRWRESDGPDVRPPEREGFGTQLIRSLVAGTMGGSVEMLWEPEGLEVVLDMPWDAATEVDYDTEVDPLQHSTPLSGGRGNHRPGNGRHPS